MKVNFEMHRKSNLNKTYAINAKDCTKMQEELWLIRTLNTPWGPVTLNYDALGIFHSTFGNWKSNVIDQSTEFLLEITIFESIGIFYPKWNQLRRQPPAIQENWRELLKQIKKHEEGIHWERYRKKVVEVSNFLKSKTNFTSQDLNNYLQRVDREHSREQEIAHAKAEKFKFNCP